VGFDRPCADTDLAKLAYDARGRAYELGVSIDYHRRAACDGERTARMPSVVKASQTERRLAGRLSRTR